ncbi:MAG TPA: hypothetical protein VG755_22460, partial [Nannocystaceae bacterium]|nr:hypothetical protein [Nannocystaceae bacterium]
QRYATVSRLYWYTDLAAAQHAARAHGKPILSLRMLGRLDEDLSCANSRFFRVALYGNAELSRWLDAHFVLHWSSERAVPRMTIDYGDGRRIETTVAGNSAHWVLDADGRVLDVVPGLMTPHAFQGELAQAVALAQRLASEPTDAATRARVLAGYHAQRYEDARFVLGRGLPIRVEPEATPAIAAAERITISKMVVEAAPVRSAKLGPLTLALDDDREMFTTLGRDHLMRHGWPTGDDVLDAQSRALLAALRPFDWQRSAPLDAAGTQALADDFAASLVADTGLNLAKLAPHIHAELARRAARGELDFADVNAWLYESVFLTPASDRWLGLATPGVFTGLPGDGVTTAG